MCEIIVSLERKQLKQQYIKMFVGVVVNQKKSDLIYF